MRKGVGAVANLTMPNFNDLSLNDCTYYSKVSSGATDYLASVSYPHAMSLEAAAIAALSHCGHAGRLTPSAAATPAWSRAGVCR